MPLRFAPYPGQIIICDFTTGFIPPEMVKVRPVLVLSRRRRRERLSTVVPLSSDPPDPVQPWHHQMDPTAYPPARTPMWAKADMLATVSFDRLDRVRIRERDGTRRYVVYEAPQADLDAVRQAVRTYLEFP